MQVLDTTIANVSIPTIAGNLGVSANQGTWVITSFAVANAITVPLTGWLTQRMGQVRLFVISTLLFVLSSWLCGFSWSLGRSEEHTSELQSLMRISYAVFCLKKTKISTH